MTLSESKASVSLKKNLEGSNFGLATTLRKKYDDVTLSFSFNENTLKTPKDMKGAILSAEKPLAGAWKVNSWWIVLPEFLISMGVVCSQGDQRLRFRMIWEIRLPPLPSA